MLAACLSAQSTVAMAGVEDVGTIDAMLAESGKPLVYLVIIQDRAWGPETHVMLGNKISSYLNYALSGQLVRDNPPAEGKKVRIVLVSEIPPADGDVQVLSVLKEQITAAGIDFLWGGEADLLRMVDAQ